VSVSTNAFHLVWAKSSLRHPRVASARDALIATPYNDQASYIARGLLEKRQAFADHTPLY